MRAVFDSVAGKYDLMNDLMSLGAHRGWKAFALARTGLRSGDTALDVAGGTGDLKVRRHTLHDLVRLLESHVEHGDSQGVCVKSAIRLEEIYRVVKKDPARAKQLIDNVRERFPDAPEWVMYDEAVKEVEKGPLGRHESVHTTPMRRSR